MSLSLVPLPDPIRSDICLLPSPLPVSVSLHYRASVQPIPGPGTGPGPGHQHHIVGIGNRRLLHEVEDEKDADLEAPFGRHLALEFEAFGMQHNVVLSLRGRKTSNKQFRRTTKNKQSIDLKLSVFMFFGFFVLFCCCHFYFFWHLVKTRD